MRSLNNTLRKKILFSVGGPIAVMLAIAATILVMVVSSNTRERVKATVMSQVHAEALDVQGFFAKYGHLSKTFAESPMMIDWFDNNKERGKDHSSDPNYALIDQNFSRVSNIDDNIYSAFFASNHTAEYFRENEITGVNANYFATKRPWYGKAKNYRDFTVGSPSADLTTGVVSAVIQAPVRNRAGELVGIGGIDLLLGEIGNMIDEIKYQGEGYAILLDDTEQIVHFPKDKALNKFKINTTKYDGDGIAVKDASGREVKEFSNVKPNHQFADFDTHDETSGFKELVEKINRDRSGYELVEFMDEDFYVAFQPAKLDFPIMDWTVVLMIPAHLIEDPISDAGIQSAFAVLLLVIVATILIVLAANRITKPITRLSTAMQDIAEGEGDLTKRIDVDSNDEVGELAEHFNTFISKLRSLLQQTNQHSELVSQTSDHLSKVSSETNEEIQQEKSQVDSVTAAVTEMAATVQEISRNAGEANDAAADAERQTSTGLQLSSDAMNEMNNLAASMAEAVETVNGLGEESKNIGSVIDVINGIAEQTNLLALNAAIEAARAGEQGRGFAVVADEVRSLASRTQESTKDISTMVDKLRSIAQAAEAVMNKGQSQTSVGVDKTQQVLQSLDAINISIKTVQEQSGHIAVATEQQTVVAESVNQSLHSINSLVDNTAEHAYELSGKADDLNKASSDLHEIVGRFKV